MESVPCPFVYSNGKTCQGYVVRIEAYNARLAWTSRDGGGWEFDFAPRSHFHLFCSLKGNHAGSVRADDPQMKFYGDQLPEAVQAIMAATGVGGLSDADTEGDAVPKS